VSQAIPNYPEQIDEQQTVFNNRGKLIVGLAIIVVTMGYFGFLAFKSATVYYYTVGEMNEVGPTLGESVVRVSGKLVPDSFQREGESTLARFSLTDGTESLAAVHNGVVPDLFFNEHSEIILEGQYGVGGVFESHNVIVKCPSKYIAKQ
jgi:cytochrome c-type biogenesis protein CcmE